MKKEFKILSRIVRDYLPEDYEWEVDDGEMMKAKDFDGRVSQIRETVQKHKRQVGEELFRR